MSISVGWLLAPLFVAVILFDLRVMRIPNRLVALIAIVAVAVLVLDVAWDEALLRVAVAGAVLLIGLVLFALRLMGGGDIKVLTVMMLLISTDTLPIFGLLLSASIFFGIAMMGIARALAKGHQTRWRSLWDRQRFPLGLPIGMAGLAYLFMGQTLLEFVQ